MEDNIDEDYAHEKGVCKDFKTKNLGESNDSNVQSDTLLLADLLENVRNFCLEIYELDPVSFLSPKDYHGKQP